jgi:hypothetical protein
MDLLKEEVEKRNGSYNSKKDFNYVQLRDPESFLNFCVKNRFVLHGSAREIVGELHPHKANDESKEFGNQDAIYLTKAPIISMFTALTGGVEVGIRRNSVNSEIDEEGNYHYPKTFFGVLYPEKIQSSGYVYVFSEEVVDDSEGSEYISRKSIKPVLVVKVKREDFRFPIEKLEKNGAKGGI